MTLGTATMDSCSNGTFYLSAMYAGKSSMKQSTVFV